MASRRVSISALLCEDDPPSTSQNRLPPSSSPFKVPTSSPQRPIQPDHYDLNRESFPSHYPQIPAPRRTPSPDLSLPPSYVWPLSISRPEYNTPSQDLFPSLQSNQHDPEPLSSSLLRTSQQLQSSYMPLSPSRPTYSQSPFPTTCLSSDSPASTISLTRPPSIRSPGSPLLYTQRSAPSPGGYYHSSSFSGSSHQDSSFQASVSPKLRQSHHNSHTEPVASSLIHHSSLSRISTTSSSSFPQTLLNPVSPHQSSLGGLEALVQAATAERDRLEAKASLDRKADASRSTLQTSPDLLFRSSHEAPRMHLQAPAPRTAIAPSIISGPLLRDSYSESSLRMGASPEVHLSKRRRQSNTSSGSERSWDSPDSSSQFGGLMGPGMKPRRLSSGARTEPHLSTSSRDAEEASALRSRMSPPRDQPARKQLLAEEHSFQSHALDHRGPAPSAAVLVDEGRQILATEDPQSNGHHDSRSNVGLNSPPRKISRSGLIQEKWDTLPSPPHSQAFLTPLEQLASPPSASQRESLMREGNEERSPRARTPPHDNLPSSVAAVTSSAEMQSAASPEKTMVSTAPPLSTMQERSVMPVESLSPDNQMTAKQGDPVAPPTSDAYNDLPGSTELVQQPSPLSTTEVHDADVAQTAPDHESLQRTSSISPPPCQDALNQLSPEQETDPPPPTAPLPRVSSPDALSSKDEMTIDHSVVTGMDAASKTDVVTPVLESNNPVNAETSLNPLEGPESGVSPASTPPAAKANSLLVPRMDDAFTSMNVDVDKEGAPKLSLTTDPKLTQIAEQRHADMDVDEELLSLIGDDLPSRILHPISRQDPSITEDNPSSCSPLLKPEPTFDTPIPPYPSSTSTALSVKPERVSTLSLDTVVPSRDSGTSTVKLEERPIQKKKAKQYSQPKSRTKPSGSTRKPKVPADGLSLKSKKLSTAAIKKSAIAARSRSTSVMPVGTTPVPGSEIRALVEVEPDDSEEGMEDKLYCICKTKYDDERVMIACDRCDEWYHTSCVNMPDMEVDLVDQFICPLCVEKNPHLDLRTTWKRRCLNGLQQVDPNSPDSCHKPARGAFSKYCSDECGVQYMHMRISLWVENGGSRDRLWDTVKNAERREGVVVLAHAMEEQSRSTMKMEGRVLTIVQPKITKTDRELARLRERLETLVQKREALKAEMDVVAWREKVTELAIQHADTIDQCGWDQRLCFGDEEVTEFGTSVLESYEEGHSQVDMDGAQEEAEWWCMGKKKCDRHFGWQKLRMAEVEFDKETKDQALQKLTKLEREIRKRVEDILDPQAHLGKTKIREPSSPRVPVLSRPAVNGQLKHKPNGDQSKKGKKRKE